MSLVYLVAMKSKDQHTKIGAVIVDDDNDIISVGYNGIPRRVNDDVKSRSQRPEKYNWYEHAERNAIFNAARKGKSTKNCRMYTNGMCCADCGRGLVQAGIKEVIFHAPWDKRASEKWLKSGEFSKIMFKEAGTKVRYLDSPIITTLVGLQDSKKIFDINSL